MTQEKVHANRLVSEKSPYLLQHANNPIHWYAWSEFAFTQARLENKLVFLSIGYSTCHWCHVMERESFADNEVAQYMNSQYVAIKVDREERPDLDQFYMRVCRLLTGSGGWPLTIVMTADKAPVFAGTYFPKKRTYQRQGLLDLLMQLAEKWRIDQSRVEQIGAQIIKQLANEQSATMSAVLKNDVFHDALRTFERAFDRTYGGFSKAPKFPLPLQLLWLMQQYERSGEANALDMAELTLQRMARGGLYDHVGFGFFRYSTDDKWLFPHFEKILYDNALLIIAYVDAYQLTSKTSYRAIAEQTISYVVRELRTEHGAFMCAEDAETDGREGFFYTWSHEELHDVLSREQVIMICDILQMQNEPHHAGKFLPNQMLFDIEQFARANKLDKNLVIEQLHVARKALFTARNERTRPHKDDKILTAWNALMIVALAKAARVWQAPSYLEGALEALSFIESHLQNDDGHLLARYRDGEAAIAGFLNDYAFLSWAYLELYQTTMNSTHLLQAISLSEQLLHRFADLERGGMFFTDEASNSLPFRTKEWLDGALPSGNGVALLVLARLAHITSRADFTEYVERTLQFNAHRLLAQPTNHAMFLQAFSYWIQPPVEMLISGSLENEETKKMVEWLQRVYLPNANILYYSPQNKKQLDTLVPKLHNKLDATVAAVYICESFQCNAPFYTCEQLEKWYAERTFS